MALYSASVKPVSRGGGRSATAAAAYRNAERITDERTGEIHDYTRRSGVDHVAAFAPHGRAVVASAELWNQAEAAEVRKNARVAREVLVALPHELDQVQRCELARSIAQELADRYGTAGTLAVHQPDREGDNRNHHVHILMTTRRIEADGQLGEKTRELDDVKRGPQEVEWIRGMIEQRTNHALEQAGIEARVDRRSLVDQRAAALRAGDKDLADELDRPATVHEGPRVTQIRREAVMAGRAPLGALDRAAANDQVRRLEADRAEHRRLAEVISLAEHRAKAEAAKKAERAERRPGESSLSALIRRMKAETAGVAQLRPPRPVPAPEPTPQPLHQVEPRKVEPEPAPTPVPVERERSDLHPLTGITRVPPLMPPRLSDDRDLDPAPSDDYDMDF